jgi:hypothetical protein
MHISIRGKIIMYWRLYYDRLRIDGTTTMDKVAKPNWLGP